METPTWGHQEGGVTTELQGRLPEGTGDPGQENEQAQPVKVGLREERIQTLNEARVCGQGPDQLLS